MGTPDPVTFTSPILAVDDVHVSYGAVRALRGVSLQLQAGEVIALLGTNGAGMSTLLRTISGLLRPPHGRIDFGGSSIGGAPHWRSPAPALPTARKDGGSLAG